MVRYIFKRERDHSKNCESLLVKKSWTHENLPFTGTVNLQGFPSGAYGKESTHPCSRHKRHSFDPRVRKIPWSSEWEPTPVFLPGKFHGRRSLAGYSPWGCKELDTTEHTHTHTHTHTHMNIIRKPLVSKRY